jgi:hypothetical protein
VFENTGTWLARPEKRTDRSKLRGVPLITDRVDRLIGIRSAAASVALDRARVSSLNFGQSEAFISVPQKYQF